MKKIIESNKLIAEFMGFNLNKKLGVEVFYNDSTCEVLDVDKLQFHSSWDWLIPVVQKCNSVSEIRITEYPYISPVNCTNIKVVWEAVVNFIEYYNSKRK